MSEDVRPYDCPEHWVRGACSNCERVCWYDPAVQVATAKIGKKFYPTCGADCSFDMAIRLAQNAGRREPPIAINERVHLSGELYAHFDGKHVAVDLNGSMPVLRLTAIAMAHLFDLNRRIQESFPTAFAIDLSEIDE